MKHKPNKHFMSKFLLLISLALIQPAHSTDQQQAPNNNQTSMVLTLKSAINQGGAAAAKTRFAEIYPADKDNYSYDAQAFMSMISTYMNAGEIETAVVLAEINATLSQDMIQAQMADSQPELLALIQQQQQVKSNNKQPTNPTKQLDISAIKRGPLRADLDRFIGLFGAADEQQPAKQLWVSKTCEGQLVVGATWGDVAPWRMRATGDTKFTYEDNFMALNIGFKTDANNQAIELTHDLKGLQSPLIRRGALTADYPECIKAKVR